MQEERNRRGGGERERESALHEETDKQEVIK